MAFSSFWARVGSISAPFAGRELVRPIFTIKTFDDDKDDVTKTTST